MKKFEIGKVYLRPGLSIPSFWVRITERTEETITFEELEYPGSAETYPIKYDEVGNEVIQVWRYYNEIGYMRA